MEDLEQAKHFAQLWCKSRYEANVSQEQMALSLGVSKKTIANWEKGLSSPTLKQGLEWFEICAINPLRYFLNFLYPEYFVDISDASDDQYIRDALIHYINSASSTELHQMAFVITGEHGSDWYGLLQMLTAHCHTSMQSRVMAARTILDNYKIESKAQTLIEPDEAKPNIELLDTSVQRGLNAALNGEQGYSIV